MWFWGTFLYIFIAHIFLEILFENRVFDVRNFLFELDVDFITYFSSLQTNVVSLLASTCFIMVDFMEGALMLPPD